ncbi:MAG TPA: GNAT family N-acetyltransferase [Acidimicrobiales bacterium]|nr:GNAT family N-acetyltransferase [Acidimicrobiales bacterium]
MDLRPITEDELPAFVRVDFTGFGLDPTEDNDEGETLELDRALGAFDGDELVGTTAAYSFELTLPGLTYVPAAGVTWVAVLPTHRRRGVLRAMMARQLDDIPEPVAVLGASEAPIYGRFGYGLASVGHMVHVDPRRSEFREPVADDGRVVLLDPETAAKALPDVFDRSRKVTPGDHQRSQAWWDHWFKDKEHWREGATSRFYVVHETSAGEADGFAAYRIKAGWDDHGVPSGELRVESLVTVTAAARAALWRYLLDVDLIATVKAQWVAPDDPLRLLLVDPRAARVTGVVDDLWVRLLDVPTALSARRYDADGRLVLEVVDSLRPQTGGRFVLDGGECTRTDAAPDLSLDVADLGSLYLGGVGAGVLHRAGRIEEHRPGAVALADQMFRSDPLPFNQTEF